MAEVDYKVLITTSGLGQRLGELTKYTNKALIRVGKKPALSYIIESYPKEVPLVITTGHYADQIKDFIGIAYPDRNVEFVDVDKYSGEGSSLGYSMLQAKDKLQCPFIYHACDTVVTESIPAPDKNWVIGYKGEDASQYATIKVIKDTVLSFNDKGAIDFDYIHIGLVGIHDHDVFWRYLEGFYRGNPNDEGLNDSRVISKMLADGYQFKLVPFSTWYDIGNTAALHYARQHIPGHFGNLDKVDESIFIFDDFVVKFFYDPQIVKDRVSRAKNLKGLVPEVQKTGQNFYRYRYIPGELYSRVITLSDFSRFLDWTKSNLWLNVKEVEDSEFKKICREFYETKTKQRIKRFLEENGIKDEAQTINGDYVPSINDVLDMVDFDWLSQGEQRQFHGDFILDNIIKTENGYCLLDWRQNFGGLLKTGDIYYDLAKLNHNLIVNHDVLNNNLFTINVNSTKVNCDIMRKHELVASQELLFEFLLKEGFDPQKVKVLTALIWLNMSPLHHYPLNLFLYYFGKWNLWRTLQENK